MTPISHPATGGDWYIPKYTDHYSRRYDIFSMKKTRNAEDELKHFKRTVYVAIGRRFGRLPSDKSGECIRKAFKQTLQRRCYKAGVLQYEFYLNRTSYRNKTDAPSPLWQEASLLKVNFPSLHVGRCSSLPSTWLIGHHTARLEARRRTTRCTTKMPTCQHYGRLVRGGSCIPGLTIDSQFSIFEDKAWEGIVCG